MQINRTVVSCIRRLCTVPQYCLLVARVDRVNDVGSRLHSCEAAHGDPHSASHSAGDGWRRTCSCAHDAHNWETGYKVVIRERHSNSSAQRQRKIDNDVETIGLLQCEQCGKGLKFPRSSIQQTSTASAAAAEHQIVHI